MVDYFVSYLYAAESAWLPGCLAAWLPACPPAYRVLGLGWSDLRLIRPAVGLALALDEPHRVLLSSLAVLQDAAFARSSTHVGR